MITIKSNTKSRESTLERAIKILEYLTTSKNSRLSDIAERFNIPNGTTYNILKTLENYKLIEREESSKQYRLGFKLFQLGNHVGYIRKLRDISIPYMRELTKESGETSQLGIIFEEELYFLEIIETPNHTKTRATVGLSLPLYAPAAGKILFAYQDKEERKRLLNKIDYTRFTANTIKNSEEMALELDRIVKNGYALDDEEVFLGTSCIAAPVYDSRKKVCAALGITGDTRRIEDNISSLVNIVQHEAMNVSFKLGYQVP